MIFIVTIRLKKNLGKFLNEDFLELNMYHHLKSWAMQPKKILLTS